MRVRMTKIVETYPFRHVFLIVPHDPRILDCQSMNLKEFKRIDFEHYFPYTLSINVYWYYISSKLNKVRLGYFRFEIYRREISINVCNFEIIRNFRTKLSDRLTSISNLMRKNRKILDCQSMNLRIQANWFRIFVFLILSINIYWYYIEISKRIYVKRG